MPRPHSLNFKRMNAELAGSDAAVDPLLVSAKITVLKVDGRDVPAADAPLPIKIAAIGALIATGDRTQDSAELIAANGQMATQVETLQAQLATAQATTGAQVQKITALEGQLATAQAAVQQQTAQAGTNTNLLDASNREVARLTKELNAMKSTLAQRCIAANCLDFASLGANATAEQKMGHAMTLPHEDLFKAYSGAVNAALARTGVSLEVIPAARPAGPGAERPQLKGRERFTASIQTGMGGSPIQARN